jgi:Protein of unknown function (DUF2934)
MPKEYSVMPRSKSIPGSKPSRSKAVKPQSDAVNTAVPEVNAVSATAAEVAPEMNAIKAAEEVAESKTTAQPASSRNDASESKVNLNSRKLEDGRKFEVVKTESRKNLVPINLEDEIRRRAYELYEQRGTSAGSEAEDWFAAEREVRQRYRQQSA